MHEVKVGDVYRDNTGRYTYRVIQVDADNLVKYICNDKEYHCNIKDITSLINDNTLILFSRGQVPIKKGCSCDMKQIMSIGHTCGIKNFDEFAGLRSISK